VQFCPLRKILEERTYIGRILFPDTFAPFRMDEELQFSFFISDHKQDNPVGRQQSRAFQL
jgi:hypothetical protein